MTAVAAPSASVRVPSYLRLGRVSNLPTVWTNALAASVLAGGGLGAVLLPMLVIVSLLYTGGMYLNDAFDREFDAARYPSRPIPSGAVSPITVFALGGAQLVAAVALAAGVAVRRPQVSPMTGPLLALVLAGAIVYYVLILDPVVRDHPATRRAARRQRRGEFFVHLRRDVPTALRPVLGPTLPAGFPGSRFRLALRERGRLALPRALGRRQLLLESVPLSAEPIPLGSQARSLVLQAVPLVLQASDLRVPLRDVSSQPPVGLRELFDAFSGLEAEQSHPRHNSGRHGFCPVLIEKPYVSAGSDPLFNYGCTPSRFTPISRRTATSTCTMHRSRSTATGSSYASRWTRAVRTW